MSEDALIEPVAAAVAQAYRAQPLDDAAGVLLIQEWGDELAPFALELTEVDEDAAPDGNQEELGAPELDESAAAQDLRAAVQADVALLERYLLALAGHIHGLVGVPVLVHEIEMPIAEQLRRQSGVPPEDDPYAGMDIVVRVRIDEQRTAAVARTEAMGLLAFARAGDPFDAVSLGPWLTVIGLNPHVVAGELPHDATRVRVQDRKGTWHEATLGDVAWLCALPQRGRDDEQPSYELLDANNAPIEDPQWRSDQPPDLRADEQPVRAGALVPSLWLTQGDGGPIFFGWEGPRERATALRFVGGEWDVVIATEPTTVKEAYERRLIRALGHSTATARKRMRTIDFSELPGTLLGEPVRFELAAPRDSWMHDQGWTAVLTTDTFTVTVQCGGRPPSSLDLVRA